MSEIIKRKNINARERATVDSLQRNLYEISSKSIIVNDLNNARSDVEKQEKALIDSLFKTGSIEVKKSIDLLIDILKKYEVCATNNLHNQKILMNENKEVFHKIKQIQEEFTESDLLEATRQVREFNQQLKEFSFFHMEEMTRLKNHYDQQEEMIRKIGQEQKELISEQTNELLIEFSKTTIKDLSKKFMIYALIVFVLALIFFGVTTFLLAVFSGFIDILKNFFIV